MPRTDASVNKRATLAKEAHLEKLMKKNKVCSIQLLNIIMLFFETIRTYSATENFHWFLFLYML